MEYGATNLEQRPLRWPSDKPRAASSEPRAAPWENSAQPLRLCKKSSLQASHAIMALLLLFLHSLTPRQYVMRCNEDTTPIEGRYLCAYTKGYLRGFSLIAVNVTLLVALRSVVQQRIYLGLLRRNAVLDYATMNPWRDPLMWMLVISLIHGLLHFVVKFAYTDQDTPLMSKLGIQNNLNQGYIVFHTFVLPAAIFMLTLLHSADIERNLLPLNKYLHKNWEMGRKLLSTAVHVDEPVLRQYVLESSTDIVKDFDRSIQDVYDRIIQHYPAVSSKYVKVDHGYMEWNWFGSMWPGALLVDLRLNDEETRSFRPVFACFVTGCIAVQALSFAFLLYQAYVDLAVEFWQQGHKEDGVGGLVLMLHAVAMVWIVSILARSFPGFPVYWFSNVADRDLRQVKSV